jgi:hypothetical protein
MADETPILWHTSRRSMTAFSGSTNSPLARHYKGVMEYFRLALYSGLD